MKSQKKNKFSIFKYLQIIISSSNGKDFYENNGLFTYRDADDEVVSSYVKPKLDLIKNCIPDYPDKIAIDIGCGNGTFTYYLSNFLKVTGIDKSKKMLERFPVTLPRVLAKAENLPFKNKTFDMVFEANLLHHVDNPEYVINEMIRLSRENIVIIEPNILNPLMFIFALIHKPDRGIFRLKIRELNKILYEKKFRLIRTVKTGMIFQNATPRFLIPLMKIFDVNFILGAYILAIYSYEN